jgi:hypothetical protein
MKKTVAILAFLSISIILSAQGIDFTGTWKLNKEKSKLHEQFSMAPKEIIIEQKDNDLNVEKHSTFQERDFTIKDKFTLDGVECINPGWQYTQKKSTVVWADDKASLKITTKFPMGDNGEMTIVEIYKIEAGNFIVETKATSSFGEVAETQVFEKQ